MKTLNFSPFPVLKTERLLLRPLSDLDAEAIFFMRQPEVYHEHTDTIPDESIDSAQKYIEKMLRGVSENRWLVWGIESLSAGDLLGTISLWQFDPVTASAEVGYGLKIEAQGNGYMFEALQAVTAFAFDVLELKFVDAYTELGHKASEKMLIQSEFVKIGQVDDQGYTKERIFRMGIYRKTKEIGNNSLLDK